MSTLASEFISRFHNIEGITIGDRRRQLFSLLRDHNSLKQDEVLLADIIRNLKPDTYLQQKFLVDILIYFKRYPELYNLFVGEDEVLMKPIWKEYWFFEKLLQENSNDFLVNEVFINLSYVMRIRLLKNVHNYTSDETKVDNLYDVVFKKYGVQNANLLLAGCSFGKMLEVLNVPDCKFKFSNKDLIFIHKYKKEYIVQLLQLEYTRKIFDFYDYNCEGLSVIAGKDFNFFFEIFQNNSCSNIGKRLTKKLLSSNREFVISKAANIYQTLHQRTFLKALKSDFKNVFFQTWPSFRNFRLYTCLNFLRFYPKENYFEIFEEGMQKVYGKSLIDEHEFIIENIVGVVLENIKDISKREMILEIIMKNSKDDYTLPQYYGIQKAIPVLKRKISAADGVHMRESLIRCLVKSCKINDDSAALLEVLKYFTYRHRNDTDSVRSSFLSEIKDRFDMTTLTNEHWSHIFEIMKVGQIKNELYEGQKDMFILYIKFLFKNNAPQQVINDFFEKTFNQLRTCLRSINDYTEDTPQLYKYFLSNFISKTQSLQGDEDEKSNLCFELFVAILAWNKVHPDEQFTFTEYPHIKESIKLKLKKPSYSSKSYISKFITGLIPCDQEFYNEIELIFWENISSRFEAGIVEYYLRKKPLKINGEFDKFITAISKAHLCDSLCIWRLLKHYDHLGLPIKTVSYLKLHLSDSYVYSIVAIALSTLMKPVDFMSLMSIPIEEKMDIDDEEETEKYRRVESLMRYSKYLNSSSVLPCIIHFCKGDYLHSALMPLYYYFFHSAEKHLLDQLKILSTRAVSVRKHAVKLACSVSPVHIVCMLVTQMTETEKNQSVIEHLYKKTFKYFLIHQTQELWSLIKLQISSLDFLESHTFKDTCSMRDIPRKFKMLYLKFIWDLLDNAENQGHEVSHLKENLIKSLDETVFKELSYDFCSNLIKDKFMKLNAKNCQVIHNFILNCLKYGQDKDRILNDVFAILNVFKKNYILQSDINISRKSRSYVENFISLIYYNFSNDNNLDLTLLNDLYNCWMKIFTPLEDIKNYIRLKLLIELRSIKTFDMYVLKTSEIFNDLVKEFGIHGIIDCFSTILQDTLPDNIFGTDNYNMKKYMLALKLAELPEAFEGKLLAISLLPLEIPENVECQQILFKLIDILKASDNKSILANLDLFITSF